MWLVEVLQTMHDAVGSQVVDEELQGLHLFGRHVVEGDGVVADAVSTLGKQEHVITDTVHTKFLTATIRPNVKVTTLSTVLFYVK